ncbi:5-methylthioadenosine/S-adenosylhomocysteine deaminase [Neorhizobium galegae bv. officinalis]|uniref:5-methylthioadenosine/S-adenosylhomocysteine deaminase n=1 Tax=Neorhizobium galegae bv. officinalis TaxID=323656 RepID=A0A0T7FDZ8_NEOGA|nr:amidohydrolase family protein [Neorhizobium galegae]CDZ33183.1 5-methylthioadenosine/S-adenosylhomocysteine deaminase [Neorhizobium galegae bv. officinalis]
MCRFCNNRTHAPAELGSGSGKIIAAPANMPAGVGDPDRLTLIRGGAVLSMDNAVGNFSKGDVLIRGSRIVEVAASITAPEAAVIDASGMIVMPGFVDTHHHQFETALRSLLADAILINDGRPENAANYYEWMLQKFSVLYRPQDVYISELFGGLSQIDAGVTTVMDVSQIHHSPEHSDAAITALRDAGRRGVFGYFEGWGDAAKYPGDARRIKAEHFASDDQLLTMVMGGEIYLPFHEEAWALGRELGIPIALHVVGTFGMQAVFDQLAEAGRFGPDNIFIHMTGMSDMAWKRVADAGSHISLSVPIEMQMRHGNPPLQQALDLGLQPSLSTDVECTMTADMFTQMRSAITLQRMLANDKALRGEEYPKLLSAIDVIRFATIEGARGLKLDHKTGTLTPGKEADIILLDANAINVAPLNHVPGAVVTLMERSNVSTVLCAGKIRKWQGTLLGHDIARLRSELEASRDFLLDAAGIRPDLF